MFNYQLLLWKEGFMQNLYSKNADNGFSSLSAWKLIRFLFPCWIYFPKFRNTFGKIYSSYCYVSSFSIDIRDRINAKLFLFFSLKASWSSRFHIFKNGKFQLTVAHVQQFLPCRKSFSALSSKAHEGFEIQQSHRRYFITAQIERFQHFK